MKPAITNNEIFELLQESIQISGEQFNAIDKRFDAMDSRLDTLTNRMTSLEHQYSEIKKIIDHVTNNQKAQQANITEILDRLLAIEKRLPNISEKDLVKMQLELQALVNWAIKSAHANGIALQLPKA